jgi:hypothetical protein
VINQEASMNKIRKQLGFSLSMVLLAGIGGWAIGQASGLSWAQMVSKGAKPQVGTTRQKEE